MTFTIPWGLSFIWCFYLQEKKRLMCWHKQVIINTLALTYIRQSYITRRSSQNFAMNLIPPWQVCYAGFAQRPAVCKNTQRLLCNRYRVHNMQHFYYFRPNYMAWAFIRIVSRRILYGMSLHRFGLKNITLAFWKLPIYTMFLTICIIRRRSDIDPSTLNGTVVLTLRKHSKT